MSYRALFSKITSGMAEVQFDPKVQVLADLLMDLMSSEGPIETQAPIEFSRQGDHPVIIVYGPALVDKGIEFRNKGEILAGYGPRSAVFSTVEKPEEQADGTATLYQTIVGPALGAIPAIINTVRPIDANIEDPYYISVINQDRGVDGSQSQWNESGGGGGPPVIGQFGMPAIMPSIYFGGMAPGVARDINGNPIVGSPGCESPIRTFTSSGAYSAGESVQAELMHGTQGTGQLYNVNSTHMVGELASGDTFQAQLNCETGQWSILGAVSSYGGDGAGAGGSGISTAVTLVETIDSATVEANCSITIVDTKKTLTFTNGLLTGVS